MFIVNPSCIFAFVQLIFYQVIRTFCLKIDVLHFLTRYVYEILIKLSNGITAVIGKKGQ